ncbi:MAG: hypothetical protein MAG451_02828 [Anaerolineales bacterium]|nr:hypothetical protein [Anaerolineales bacterium]
MAECRWSHNAPCPTHCETIGGGAIRDSERNNYPNPLPLDLAIQAERNGTFYFFHVP